MGLERYAVTVTLNPKLFRLNTRGQYKRAVLEMNILTEKLEEFDMFFEMMEPELTEANNIHFHGILCYVPDKDPLYTKYRATKVWHDIMRPFQSRKILGFTCLKPLLDYHGWVGYINKEHEKTAETLLQLYDNCKVHVSDNLYEVPEKEQKTEKEIICCDCVGLDMGIENK